MNRPQFIGSTKSSTAQESAGGCMRRAEAGYSNCLVYALARWIRYGGYIAIRRSQHFPIPHFLWIPPDGLAGVTLRHFVPMRPARGWRNVWRAAWFRGYVKRAD